MLEKLLDGPKTYYMWLIFLLVLLTHTWRNQGCQQLHQRLGHVAGHLREETVAPLAACIARRALHGPPLKNWLQGERRG